MSVHHWLRLLAFPMRTAVHTQHPTTAALADTRSPRFRCDPFARDVALDRGRASAPRLQRCRTCCLRANENPWPLRCLIFRGSIPHPMQSLCTLRDHCRQWPRNTRYQADATPYLGRTSTGWIAPALPGALIGSPSTTHYGSLGNDCCSNNHYTQRIYQQKA